MNTAIQQATQSQEITLEILQPKHVEGAITCIADTFAGGEPMSQLLGITRQEFTQFARLFIEKTAKEGLSVVAINEEQEVIGATIAEDYMTDPPLGLDTISEKFNPIFALLESLGTQYIASQGVAPDTHYHIFMCGVYQHYANRRLAQKLNQFAEDIARERKYRAVVCEATGRISQFVCANQLGFAYVDEISYKDFQLEGKRVFANISNVDSCIVYQKHL